MTPSKAKEAESKAVEEENPSTEENEGEKVVKDAPDDEEELIIKDDIDHDCFEEVDRIGDVEKLVRKLQETWVEFSFKNVL